jgi:hypothetical protein
MRSTKEYSHFVKATIAKDVVLAYPDYSKVFKIYTDTSIKQLGAVITQDNRPFAFLSRKLSDMQCKYSVTEIELLAIVETLEEFKVGSPLEKSSNFVFATNIIFSVG